MNLVTMKMKDNVPEKRVLGLSYLGLETDWDNQICNVNIEDVEQKISTHCLLLPLKLNTGREGSVMYALVHDNWLVTDRHGKTVMPQLCADLMKSSR